MTNSRKACRNGAKCEPANEREARHCQMMHSALDADALAERCGVNPATYRNWANTDRDDQIPSRHYVPILSFTADNLALITYWARLQGVVVFRAPANVAQMAQVADAVREFGDLLTTTAEANSDGSIDMREAEKIKREGEQAVAAILSLVDDSCRRALEHEAKVAR